MKSLKILQVTNRIPWPLNDGGNLATYHVAKHLGDRGHELILAALNTKKHYQDPKVVEGIAKVYTVDIDTSIRPLALFKSFFSKLPYNIQRFVSPEFSALLQSVITKEKPDVIQLEGSYQAIFIPAIREVSHAPVILRSHNVEWRIWKRLAENQKHPLKRFYFKHLAKKIRRFETETLPLFDAVIAITQEDERWYRDQGFGKLLTTINAGANLLMCPQDNKTPFFNRIGFIGSLEWEPNVEGIQWFTEHVWPNVMGEFPGAELHIAGKNPPDWMGSWQVPGMNFHGMVPDAYKFMESVHIFVVPLLSGSGMRLKVVEAMGMKKCVVSTSIGAEGIMVENGKDIILEDDPGKMADLLIELLRDPDRSTEIAENGWHTAHKKYDWRNLIRNFEEVYEATL